MLGLRSRFERLTPPGSVLMLEGGGSGSGVSSSWTLVVLPPLDWPVSMEDLSGRWLAGGIGGSEGCDGKGGERGTARHNPNCGIKHVLIDKVNTGTACRSGDLRYYFEALVPPHTICLVPQLRSAELLQATPRTINTCNDIPVTSLVFITFSSQIHKITLRDQGTAEWGFPPWCLWGFTEGVNAWPGGILLVNDGEVI